MKRGHGVERPQVGQARVCGHNGVGHGQAIAEAGDGDGKELGCVCRVGVPHQALNGRLAHALKHCADGGAVDAGEAGVLDGWREVG